MSPTKATIVLASLIAGCAPQKSVPEPKAVQERKSAPEQKSVQGLLEHYPSDVKSVQAWHGHNFMVGDTPILPTEQVPEEKLLRLVGATVIVTGTWHPGTPWKPEASVEQSPVHDTNAEVIRGDGLKAASIRLAQSPK